MRTGNLLNVDPMFFFFLCAARKIVRQKVKIIAVSHHEHLSLLLPTLFPV